MENYKNSFFIITVFILLLLVVVGYGYYSDRTAKLEKALFDTMELVETNVNTKPMLINKTSAGVSKQDGVLVPKIIYRDTGSFKQVPIILYDTIREVDTVEVLVDYFSLKTYMDSVTIQDVDIKIKDTLQKNSIFAREYIIKNNRTENFYKRRMVYFGGSFGFNNQFLIGPSVQYIDKKNNLFGGSYLFSPDNSKTLLFNYSKKITFKK